MPTSLTPTDSSDDEDVDYILGSTQRNRGERHFSQGRRPPMLCLNTSVDVDMDDYHPLANGDNLSPWPLSARSKASGNLQPSPIPHHLINHSLNISGGRTATPIYGHFILGARSDLTGNNSMIKSPGMITEDEINWWQKRSLPSPISEDEDMMAGSLDDLNDQETLPPPVIPLDSHQLSTQLQPRSLPALAISHTNDSQAINVPKISLVSPAAPRQGKVGLAMGYRADCEKCRLKVPGHYSHIIRS
jgi:hypothetical protein